MKARVKEIQEQLLAKENDLVRGAKLYCAKHDIEFLPTKQQFVMRVAMRKFFKDAIAPLMRDIYEDNVKIYPTEKPEK